MKETEKQREREGESEVQRTVAIVIFLKDQITYDQTVPLPLVLTVPAKEGISDSKVGEKRGFVRGDRRIIKGQRTL